MTGEGTAICCLARHQIVRQKVASVRIGQIIEIHTSTGGLASTVTTESLAPANKHVLADR